MKRTLMMILSSSFILNFASCKTTETSEASLSAARSEQSAGDEIFGCYKVKSISSASTQEAVSKLRAKASKLCINKKPVTLSISDSSNKELLNWKFTSLDPMNCPSCYNFKGGNEYSANIKRTIVPTIFDMSLDTRGFGANVTLRLEQIINNAATSGAESAQFKIIKCGDHWRKVYGEMATSSKPAAIKLSGDSIQTTVVIPAKVSRKGGEIVFEATDRSGAMLRIITESGKFYGVFRDSKTNDESDLGQCYADVVEPGPLN
jgi:hypothetical protein